MKKKYQYTLIFTLFIFNLTNITQAQSLRFTDSSFVNLGNNSALQLTNFTIEAWIKIESHASTTETGSGGVSGAVPVITKGRGEAESAAVDVNYFLGYRLSDRKLVADFENNVNSGNNPVVSNVALPLCTWTHIAATYNVNTGTWKLYINGALDITLALGSSVVPQNLSGINACIGSSLNGGTIRPGFFNGSIDEVRIWNIVRTDAEILANYTAELTTGTGLVARYGFNENTGTVAVNSITSTGNGNFSTELPRWVEGYNQPTSTQASLDFNGSHDYVTFGKADGSTGNPNLNAQSFTLEAWIRIEGNGASTTSGTGGLAVVIPIISKGRGEAETPINLNMNYIFGITASDVLVADYEDNNNGLNHPVVTTQVVPRNTWCHVAATFDNGSRIWNIYFNGALVKTQTESSATNLGPVATSIQHASIGSALTSTGVPAGYFNGKIDEVRIWSVARTASEIAANYNQQLTSGTGLMGRWALNENCGTSINNSVSGGGAGTLTSLNIATHPSLGSASWHNKSYNAASPVISNFTPATSSTNIVTSPTLSLNSNDADLQTTDVCFFGRKKLLPCSGTGSGTKPLMTIIGMPDTQFYTAEINGGTNFIMKNQTTWMAAQRIDSNIVFVSQLGDCAQNGDNNAAPDPSIEYKRADTSFKIIENPNVPITDGIPYSVSVGNHDQGPTGSGGATLSTVQYNLYFGAARFSGRNYYGGQYGTNNDNHFELFSGGGYDWINISFEYDPAADPAVLNWANTLLQNYPNRKAIVSSHWIINSDGSFSAQGAAIYNALKGNNNLVLMLCGHVNPNGEARRSDVFNGHTIHTLLSDYQDRAQGGTGWLRIMQLNPNTGDMSVKTYSPWLNQFETDANSQFTVKLDLEDPFLPIGCANNIAPNGTASITWPSLNNSTTYEWYATATDGENITTQTIPNCFETQATIIVPIKNISLQGKILNSNTHLEWKVEADEPIYTFEIWQKGSTDNTFRLLKIIPNNNSLQKNFTNIFTTNNCEQYEYKIAATSQQSMQKIFSNIIVLKSICKNGVSINPNPANSILQIQLNTIEKNVPYQIINASGAIVQKGNINQLLKLNTATWTNGMYYATIFFKNNKMVRQFEIKH